MFCLKVTFFNSVPNKLVYCSYPSHFQLFFINSNVWRCWGLARHREKQFLMTVRIEKTRIFKNILKSKNSSSEKYFWNFRESIFFEMFEKISKIPIFNEKSIFRFSQIFRFSNFQKCFTHKFSKIFFGRRIFRLQNIFKYSSFFYSNRHEKLLLPMSCQCSYRSHILHWHF